MAGTDGTLVRLAAFAEEEGGGNPAGVWLGDVLPTPAAMQQVAAAVGYSETAFSVRVDERRLTTRYFSPLAEVAFCGHATIATGVALGGRFGPGEYLLDTAAGTVGLDVGRRPDGRPVATLTSVEPQVGVLPDGLVASVLDTMAWSGDVLDRSLPPALAHAGVWHLVLPLASRDDLARLRYDVGRLTEIMRVHDLTTIQVVHREHETLYHSRNPFPVGGVVEDPATGAAAAALGGYLREAGILAAPVSLTIEQGRDMGRPSILHVDVPTSGGIRVSGTAVPIGT